MGTFVKVVGTLADGTLRLAIDIEPRHATDAFALFHTPGTPMALAKLTPAAASQQPAGTASQPEEAKSKPGQLCVMACTFCKDPMFWRWIQVVFMPAGERCDGEDSARQFVLETCEVERRIFIDTTPNAAQLFHREIRIPFMEWRAKQ